MGWFGKKWVQFGPQWIFTFTFIDTLVPRVFLCSSTTPSQISSPLSIVIPIEVHLSLLILFCYLILCFVYVVLFQQLRTFCSKGTNNILLFIVEKASKCSSVYGSKSSKEKENLNEPRFSQWFSASVVMYIHSTCLYRYKICNQKTTSHITFFCGSDAERISVTPWYCGRWIFCWVPYI